MRGFLRSLFSRPTTAAAEIPAIRRREIELRALDDHGLRAAFGDSTDVVEAIAIVCVAASRVLQLEMFDVQLQGALGLARGRIIEMQTGEGLHPGCRLAGARRPRCPRDDGQRLSGAPRRPLDGRHL